MFKISVMTECCYAQCHFCLVPFALSVANKPFMLSVFLPNAFLLSVVAPYGQLIKPLGASTIKPLK
jgi:hypothetical protein